MAIKISKLIPLLGEITAILLNDLLNALLNDFTLAFLKEMFKGISLLGAQNRQKKQPRGAVFYPIDMGFRICIANLNRSPFQAYP